MVCSFQNKSNYCLFYTNHKIILEEGFMSNLALNMDFGFQLDQDEQRNRLKRFSFSRLQIYEDLVKSVESCHFHLKSVIKLPARSS